MNSTIHSLIHNNVMITHRTPLLASYDIEFIVYFSARLETKTK